VVNGHLRELRKRAEKVEGKEKEKRFGGFGGFSGFGEKQSVKPVAGLVLRKDRKDLEKEKGAQTEAEAFFEKSSSAHGGKKESPIASGSLFPVAGGSKFKMDEAWQREFGYRL